MLGVSNRNKSFFRPRVGRRRLLLELLCDRRVLASLTGAVFNDVNLSLRQDVGESGLEERLVYLDLDQSGSFSTGDTWRRTESGDFSFEQIAEGLYQVRLYDGSSSQVQTAPRTIGAIREPVEVNNLSQVAAGGDFIYGVSEGKLVRVGLIANSLKSLELPAAGTDLAVLPDGKVLVLQDSDAQPAVIVDFEAETVVPIDLGLQGNESRWSSLAVGSDGKGLLIANDAAGKIRLFASDPNPATNASAMDAETPTAIVLGSQGAKAAVWHATESGIQVRLVDVTTGEGVGTPIDLEAVASVFAYDEANARLMGRFESGNLAIFSIDGDFSIVHEFAGFTGPADFDPLRQLLITIDPNTQQFVVLDSLTFGESLRVSSPMAATLSLHLAASGNVAAFVSASEVKTMRLDRPTFALADLADPEANAEVKFGLKITGENQPPVADETLTVNMLEDEIFSAPNLLTLASVSDADAEDDLVFLLLNAPDHGVASVNPSGTLTYQPAPNYFGQDQLTLLVHDGRSVSNPIQVTFNIAPVVDVISGIKIDVPAPVPELVLPGAPIGTIELLTPDPAGDFNIFVNDPRILIQGQLLVIAQDANFDFEQNPIVELIVQAQRIADPTEQVEVTVEIPLSDSGEPMTDWTPTTATVPEATFGAVVTEIEIVDQDTNSTYSFSVDDPRFTFLGRVLKLRDDQQLDFENESKIQLSVTVTDNDFPGASITKNMLLDVTNVNEAPIRSELAGSQTVVERVRGASVGDLSAIDFDFGDTHTFTVDDDRFEVVGKLLKLKASAAVNFEEEPSILIIVTAMDQGGLSAETSFDINVARNSTPFHNRNNPLDVNGDNLIEPQDVLIIINLINTQGPHPLDGPFTPGDGFIDVNGDGLLTPLDALLIINHLNNDSGAEPEGEQEAAPGPREDSLLAEEDVPAPAEETPEPNSNVAPHEWAPVQFSSFQLVRANSEDEESADTLLDALVILVG